MEAAPRVAVTPRQRLRWFDQKTFGVSNFVGSLPGAAWQTFFDRPREAGPHWEGFAERDGVSLSTNTVSNALEAGRMEPVFPLNQGLAMFVEWTVVAPDRNGELRPAYARFAAFSGSSLISNAWRDPSNTDAEHSLGRIGFGFPGRMGSNAFDEFWPDTKRKLFHRGARD